MSFMNHRPSKLSRMLHQVRGLVSLESDSLVKRRDLSSASQSDVQLELDLGADKETSIWQQQAAERRTGATRWRKSR